MFLLQYKCVLCVFIPKSMFLHLWFTPIAFWHATAAMSFGHAFVHRYSFSYIMIYDILQFKKFAISKMTLKVIPDFYKWCQSVTRTYTTFRYKWSESTILYHYYCTNLLSSHHHRLPESHHFYDLDRLKSYLTFKITLRMETFITPIPRKT